MPAATPVTIPVVAPMLTDRYELLHVPPVLASASVTALSIHTDAGPVIGVGASATVTIMVEAHPVEVSVYETVVTPADRADSDPEVAPILAMPGLLLVHVPPAVASVYTDVVPEHATRLPVIAAGDSDTVTVFITVQPEPSE